MCQPVLSGYSHDISGNFDPSLSPPTPISLHVQYWFVSFYANPWCSLLFMEKSDLQWNLITWLSFSWIFIISSIQWLSTRYSNGSSEEARKLCKCKTYYETALLARLIGLQVNGGIKTFWFIRCGTAIYPHIHSQVHLTY